MYGFVSRQPRPDLPFVHVKISRSEFGLSSVAICLRLVDLGRQDRRGDFAWQFRHDILPLLNKLCPALYKVISSKRVSGSDISRNSHNFAILFGGEPSSY